MGEHVKNEAYTWNYFLGCKQKVTEKYVQERINDWRPGRYDISKADDKKKYTPSKIFPKYADDWYDIHSHMGELGDDAMGCDRFALILAEKFKHLRAAYGDAWKKAHATGSSDSTRKAAKANMEWVLEWVEEFTSANKEEVRETWNKQLITGKWTGGYMKYNTDNGTMKIEGVNRKKEVKVEHD
jgi:hypothetical protein